MGDEQHTYNVGGIAYCLETGGMLASAWHSGRRPASGSTTAHLDYNACANSNADLPQLPVHHPFVEHKRRWKAEGHVRLDQDKGCRSPLLQLGLQEGRC